MTRRRRRLRLPPREQRVVFLSWKEANSSFQVVVVVVVRRWTDGRTHPVEMRENWHHSRYSKVVLRKHFPWNEANCFRFPSREKRIVVVVDNENLNSFSNAPCN